MLGRLLEALASYDQALALGPDHAEALNNRGAVLEELARFDEALASYDRAVAVRPDYADARFNRSLLLLLRGDFARGWADYEWRLLRTDAPSERSYAQPKWSGETVAGKTLLIHAEQGYGDTIQFLRYVPLAAERGGKVVLEVPGPLIRLAENLPGVIAVVRPGDPPPEFDLHCPLLSLPLAFGTRLETIPASVPYLTPPANALAEWAARLAGRSELKVGLAWSGNPENQVNLRRSIALPMLEPLWGITGVSWFSQQVGDRAGDVALAPRGAIDDLSPLLTDFGETAAAICHLDLVITVETAVAHLAGALGRPTWVPLPFVPAWRWLLGREDSPWYPTMRLFRQPSPGDWTSVIARIADALAARVQEQQIGEPATPATSRAVRQR